MSSIHHCYVCWLFVTFGAFLFGRGMSSKLNIPQNNVHIYWKRLHLHRADAFIQSESTFVNVLFFNGQNHNMTFPPRIHPSFLFPHVSYRWLPAARSYALRNAVTFFGLVCKHNSPLIPRPAMCCGPFCLPCLSGGATLAERDRHHWAAVGGGALRCVYRSRLL